MVRASFGIYSTTKDVDARADAVSQIAGTKVFYRDNYNRLESGDYLHKTFEFDHTQRFSVRGVVDAWLKS